MNRELYPFRFAPVYKDYPWGGDRIIRHYHRPEPLGVYAESWEIADHPDGMSILTNGSLAGLTLHELVARFGEALLGGGRAASVFPLLLKLIDARERLSVQVHPDEEAARRFGGEPKTELWYALDIAPGAGVFAGLLPGVDREALLEAVETGRVERVLRHLALSRGEAVYVPGGRVHAIDAGCLLFEIQQTANTTYRLYDWGRTWPGRAARLLQLREALRAIRWDDPHPVRVQHGPVQFRGSTQWREVFRSPYFALEHWVLAEPQGFTDGPSSFRILFVVSGSVGVESAGGNEVLAAGCSCLLPAALEAARLVPGTTGAELLVARLP